jgi:hypothetical protein
LREKVLGGFAPEEVHKTAQNPTKNGTKKRHNLDLPLDCATIYRNRKLLPYPYSTMKFQVFQPNFGKNPEISGKNRPYLPKKWQKYPPLTPT